MIRTCDYVVNILPSTPATQGLLSLETLEAGQANKPYVINVGRGDIAPTDSVWAEAVDNLFISGCLLDVCNVEPLPQGSPLWAYDEITITPHISAVSFPKDVAEAFAENLARFVKDPASLKHQVDFSAGY